MSVCLLDMLKKSLFEQILNMDIESVKVKFDGVTFISFNLIFIRFLDTLVFRNKI